MLFFGMTQSHHRPDGMFLIFGGNWHHKIFGWIVFEIWRELASQIFGRIVFEIWGDWRPTKFPGNFWGNNGSYCNNTDSGVACNTVGPCENVNQGWGNIFPKITKGEWRCETCSMMNMKEDKACISCNTQKAVDGVSSILKLNDGAITTTPAAPSSFGTSTPSAPPVNPQHSLPVAWCLGWGSQPQPLDLNP